jgi:hypothetical protein
LFAASTLLLTNHNEASEKIRHLILPPKGRAGTTPIGTSLWQFAPGCLTGQPILSDTCTDNSFAKLLSNIPST